MARAAHTFCATKGVGDVAACSTLTVAQELGYVPFTSASPSGGSLVRRRRARRVHTDVTDWTDQHAVAQPCVEARQQLTTVHDRGDAELGGTCKLDGTQSERGRAEHWRRYDRLERSEAEDALTR